MSVENEKEDLTATLLERMAKRYPIEQNKETESTTEAVENEKDSPVDVKSALVSRGLDVSALSEDEVAEQVAERIRRADEAERELQALRQKLQEETEAKQALLQQVQTKPVTKTEEKQAQDVAEAVRKWQKVEVDPELYRLVEEKDGRFVAKESLGLVGIEAAKELNKALEERKRRAELITNDLAAALEDCGYTPSLKAEIQKTIADSISSFQKDWEAKVTQQSQEAIARQEQEKSEKSFSEFMDSRKSEFFKLNDKGDFVYGLDNNPVLTEAGKNAKKIAMEIMESEAIQFPAALRMACRVLDAQKVATPQVQQEDKKRSFIDKGRGGVQQGASAQVTENPSQYAKKGSLRELVLANMQGAG